MTEPVVCKILGQRNGRAAISTPGGHSTTKFGQDCPGHFRVSERRSIGIQSHGEHAATNITSDSLRVDQMRSRYGNADAHVGGQMHVGHYGYLLNVWGASEAFNRLRHVVIHWCR